MTKTERTCPRCGLTFASEKLDGLCPSCLLNSLFDDSDPGETQAFWEEENASQTAAATDTQTPPTPIRRFSHFELLEELGRGGMGIVYRARDVGTGRIVALKVLQAHHLEVPDLVLRFRSEVRAVTSLDHPHVLPVHEVGEYEGIPFFSMKLTTGGSLAQRIGDYLGRPTEIARLMAKVARGVGHAHERGILHRDLKPANILLDAAGEPFVCDFGLAKWLEDDRNLTITSAVLGTPHYIAPEQASGQKGLTTAADIYSLGSIIYELLTARPPFVGQSIIETLRLASEHTPERPSSLVQNIPKDLETICLKCLQREPASRYPSASALATDLENWLDGRPILARPVSAGEQLWRWAKRNPLPAALIASVAMLLAATAVVATVSAIRIEKARDRAVAAERETQDQLYASLLAQARAARLTGRAGQRFDALEALAKAAKIHPSLDVHNEAVAALAITDIKIDPARIWRIGSSNRPPRVFDKRLETIADEVAPGVVRILRLSNQKEDFRLSEPDAPRIEFMTHSGSRYLAIRHAGGLIKVWDVGTGKKLYELTNHPYGSKASWYAFDCNFSADEKNLAVGNPDGGATIYDADNGRIINKIPASFAPGCLAFSPDGGRLAMGSYRGSNILIWDLKADKPAASLQTPGPAYHLAWNATADALAVGSSDMNIYVFNASGPLLGVCKGHRQEVTQVIFSPEGNRLISTGRDVTIRLWSLSASTQSGNEPPLFTQEVLLPSHGGEPSLRLSVDGVSLALTKSETACIATLDGGERVCRTLVNGRPPGRATFVGSVAFSPNGGRLATASYEYIDLWDVNAGRILGTFDLDFDEEKSVRFGADEETLIVGSRKSGLRKYKIVFSNGNTELRLDSILDAQEDFIFTNSPPGDRNLVPLTSSKRGIARILDLTTGKDIFRIENLPMIWDLALSPDQKTAVAGFSTLAAKGKGDLQIWNIADTSTPLRILEGTDGTIARFSPDGKWLKHGDVDYLIDTATWLPSANYSEGSAPVFSATGSWMALRMADKVLITDPQNHRLFFTIDPSPYPQFPVSSVRMAADPNGTYLALQAVDNTLLLWNLDLLKQKLLSIGLSWSGHSYGPTANTQPSSQRNPSALR
jgi:eukaryotic-like serine/threonine-protein kinase